MNADDARSRANLYNKYSKETENLDNLAKKIIKVINGEIVNRSSIGEFSLKQYDYYLVEILNEEKVDRLSNVQMDILRATVMQYYIANGYFVNETEINWE